MTYLDLARHDRRRKDHDCRLVGSLLLALAVCGLLLKLYPLFALLVFAVITAWAFNHWRKLRLYMRRLSQRQTKTRSTLAMSGDQLVSNRHCKRSAWEHKDSAMLNSSSSEPSSSSNALIYRKTRLLFLQSRWRNANITLA